MGSKSACEVSVQEAYRRLGLEPGAGLPAAKTAFRRQVKALHPDTAPATPHTLSSLASIVAAIRVIEAADAGEDAPEIEITPADAARGVTKALRLNGRPVIVRIPAGVEDGARIPAVGDRGRAIVIRIAEADLEPAPPGLRSREFDVLDDFISEFSRPSAAARFARWIRDAEGGASSAA